TTLSQGWGERGVMWEAFFTAHIAPAAHARSGSLDDLRQFPHIYSRRTRHGKANQNAAKSASARMPTIALPTTSLVILGATMSRGTRKTERQSRHATHQAQRLNSREHHAAFVQKLRRCLAQRQPNGSFHGRALSGRSVESAFAPAHTVAGPFRTAVVL